MIHTRTCVYQGMRNISFSENVTCILTDESLIKILPNILKPIVSSMNNNNQFQVKLINYVTILHSKACVTFLSFWVIDLFTNYSLPTRFHNLLAFPNQLIKSLTHLHDPTSPSPVILKTFWSFNANNWETKYRPFN